MHFEEPLEGYNILILTDKTDPLQLVFLWSSNLKTERPRLQVWCFAVLVWSSCSLFAVLRLDFKALIMAGKQRSNINAMDVMDPSPQHIQLWLYMRASVACCEVALRLRALGLEARPVQKVSGLETMANLYGICTSANSATQWSIIPLHIPEW